MKMFDQTGDAARSQGWTALVLDTNGNGKRDAYVEPDQPVDPTKDKRIVASFYAVMPSPVDGSIWGAVYGNPGAVVRLVPGSNPPSTALAEVYNVPMPGFASRGADIDRNGVVWVSLGSGHLGSFDRRKCKAPLNGPKATGDQCPEGWSFHQYPGPGFKGIGENSAEASYYTWVDQHNTFGLGDDVPMSTGNLNDGLIALKDGRMVVLRVPYPLGFYAKGFDGRIDDPKAGWKGTRAVGRERRSHAVAHRRGQRNQAAGRALPAAPRSTGEMKGGESGDLDLVAAAVLRCVKCGVGSAKQRLALVVISARAGRVHPCVKGPACDSDADRQSSFGKPDPRQNRGAGLHRAAQIVRDPLSP
jgi:hypothetical protein